jgi:spoIIIJ-associated protein
MSDQTIHDFIKSFVEQLGINIESIDDVSVAAHQMWNIHTPDSKQLIGPQGEHLRALNYIVRRLVERRDDISDHRFMIDVNGYQHKRISEVEQKAKLLGDRVRTFRSSAEMTPMNSYERMIIHALFSEDPEVTTESDGTGKMRHITLKYKSE